MSLSAIDAIQRERRLAAMRAEVEANHTAHPAHTRPHRGYDPNQPRVPKGHSDGGQWTSIGSKAHIRLATLERPFNFDRLERLIRKLAQLAIEGHRTAELDDLAGQTNDTVALTIFDGEEVWGYNSRVGKFTDKYTAADYKAAEKLRNDLIRKYPDVMNTENIGQFPNAAVFHAEVTVLLRARNKNGGTLEGRTLEVFVDRPNCPSCMKILPYVGLEIGNPTVTFIDRFGRVRTMSNDKWDD